MNAATMTFDRVERRADRTIGFALWVRHAKNTLTCAAGMAAMDMLVRSLVKSLSADKISALNSDQTAEVTKKVQDAHDMLVDLLGRNAICVLRRNRLFRASICGLEESTEDLSDIIEDLVLSQNKEFRSLLSECVQDVNSKRAAGEFVRMHG